MEQITLGQIGLAITFLVGLITGINYLIKQVKKWIEDLQDKISKSLSDQFESFDKKIDDLKQQVDDIDMETTKNFLVSMLSDLEKGIVWDDIETERFWEQYEHYTAKGGNTYIKTRVDKLKEKGILP